MQQASIHSGSADGGSGDQAQDKEKLYQLVAELSREETREAALLELSKKREAFPDLAPILWHSFGTTATLLQEIVCIYPLLSPPQLTAHASNRVCNALALLQCVASHPETRTLFLKAHIPLFLYPFLNTISKTRPFEYLRLTSLGVIGALVKMDDSDVGPTPPAPPPASAGCTRGRISSGESQRWIVAAHATPPTARPFQHIPQFAGACA